MGHLITYWIFCLINIPLNDFSFYYILIMLPSMFKYQFCILLPIIQMRSKNISTWKSCKSNIPCGFLQSVHILWIQDKSLIKCHFSLYNTAGLCPASPVISPVSSSIDAILRLNAGTSSSLSNTIS